MLCYLRERLEASVESRLQLWIGAMLGYLRERLKTSAESLL